MKKKERIFIGVGVHEGVSIGIAHVRKTGIVDIPEYNLKKSDVNPEEARLSHSVTLTKRQVRRLKSRVDSLSGPASKELTFLLDAYLHMLDDSRLIRGARRRIKEDLINAEAAIRMEIALISESFNSMEDAYLAARLDDINEVGNRLLKNLGKHHARPTTSLPKNSIIIADGLSPADMAHIDPKSVIGVATMWGGRDGHTAIMAKALMLPSVLGAPGLINGVESGNSIIIDGSAGKIIVEPSQSTLKQYIRHQTDFSSKQRRLSNLKRRPATSHDGTQFSLQANVELPAEMKTVINSGAEGIGLLRSEFMFMNRETLPSEDEQFEALKPIIQAMNGKTVTIRSLDMGADKQTNVIHKYRDGATTTALGLRGIRMSLANPDLLEIQFKAMLRAAADNPIRILLPMVSTVREVNKAREILKSAATSLKNRKEKISNNLPPLGVMIEVPGAALAADALAQTSDFFSIGSNDLTMYTLAADRANEDVSHLFNPLHTGVLRLIQLTANAALRARIPVNICGEIAGDPKFTALLIGLGLRDLSMTPTSIPKVKERIRAMDSTAAATRANLILEQIDSNQVINLLEDFNSFK